ncbi:NusG domain II-containing protein [Clostridium malenominatum]|uniref:NusG domain II-containing protein n=1 Tax=Clostridium malenominatum TaxID=1539 RepID=A0ABN1IV54_9CLOT
MKKGDKIIFLFILIITLGGFLGSYFYKNLINGKDKIAVIKENGKVIKRINLTKLKENEELIVSTEDKHYNKIIIKKDAIYISEADCPDQICVKTGAISKPGDTVVCLPNKLIIAIEGEDVNSEVDSTTY